MPEKRRSRRLDVVLPVKYTRIGVHPPEHRNGLVKNLSCEGLLFTTDEFLPRDSLVKLEVRLPSSPRPVPIVSKVSRLGASQGEDSYTFGVEFSNPSPSTHYDITLSHSFIASVDQPYRCRSLSSRSGTS